MGHDGAPLFSPMRASLTRMGRLRQKWGYPGKGGRLTPPRRSERLGEPGFQEFAQLGCRLELRDWLQFLEGGSERIRKTPDRPRPEFLVFWFKVQVVHGAGEVFGTLESALERLVDHHLGGDVRQLTFLPGFHLLSHRFEVSLHPVNPDRDAVMRENDFECFARTGVNTPRTTLRSSS
jgi:hypothetical protein